MNRRPIPPLSDSTLDYNAELVARVNREVDEALRLPRWFWPVAVVVVLGTIAASHWATL